jgi:hypothetical protein
MQPYAALHWPNYIADADDVRPLLHPILELGHTRFELLH